MDRNTGGISDLRVEYLIAKMEGRQSIVFDVYQIYSSSGIFPVALVPNNLFVCEEVPPLVVTTLDPHGFRNRADVWSANRWQIAILGDSFAMGWCVPDGEDVASLIREAYPGTTNLGVTGTYPLRQYAILKEYVPAYEPTLVIWFFFEGNDFRQSLTIRDELLLTYLSDPDFTQNLMEKNAAILAAARDSDLSDETAVRLLSQTGYDVGSILGSGLSDLSDDDIETIRRRSARHLF